jgi:hypothetical protein
MLGSGAGWENCFWTQSTTPSFSSCSRYSGTVRPPRSVPAPSAVSSATWTGGLMSMSNGESGVAARI